MDSDRVEENWGKTSRARSWSTMVIVDPLGLWGFPSIHGRNLWLINRGDPNYLLNGMILQVDIRKTSTIYPP